MRGVLIAVGLSLAIVANAQMRIDGNFSFQSDTAKKYSLYIPSGYNHGIPHRVMVGFHPFNTSRWDAASWCDTLIAFSEANNLIMVCPDGGVDGKVDDPIDTAFTSALIDSMLTWYTIDEQKMYAMGFSWGGKTTYTYGLSHIVKFGGLLPIGAAINGTNEVTEPLQQNVSGKPVYIVHGASDNPSIRFYPVRDSLISKGAILNYNLLSGVGHTIDFPNRNQILTVAYQWIDSVNCANIGTTVIELGADVKHDRLLGLYPNKVQREAEITLNYELQSSGVIQIRIFDVQGKLAGQVSFKGGEGINTFQMPMRKLKEGAYFINISSETNQVAKKIIIL